MSGDCGTIRFKIDNDLFPGFVELVGKRMEQRTGLGPVTAAWSKEGRTGTPHPLVCHAMDTAAVAELLYPVLLGPTVRAELAKGLAPLGGDPARWVSVLCGVHDLGKLSPVFQAQCLEIACSRMPNARKAIERAASALGWNPRMDLEHGLATAVHLRRRLQDWGAPKTAADEIACALGGHHGWIPDAKSLDQAREKTKHLGGPKWEAARDELLDTVAVSWGLPRASDMSWRGVDLSLPAAIGLAGLTTLSDWIASERKRFPWQPGITDAVAYAEEARQQARRVVNGMRWAPWRPSGAGFEGLFGKQPRTVQQRVAKLVAGRDRPGVLVLEAPTGEGKTKAALHVAALLADQLGMSGLYVGMPTRATGNAVYQEVRRMLARRESSLIPVLAHSTARTEMARQDRLADEELGGPVAPEGLREDADRAEQREERKKVREFFWKDSALAAPVGIGTIDRALKGMLRSKRAYLHLANLSGKVLVLDEVHGYEVRTDRLIDRLMWFCGRLGIPVVLLSATLPIDRREELLREWQSGANDTGTPPLEHRPEEPDGWQATWVDRESRERVPLTTSQQQRTVAIEHLDDLADDREQARSCDRELVNWAFDRLQDGGSAMILLDTKPRAKKALKRVREEVERRGLDYEVIFVIGKELDGEVRRAREQQLYDELGWDATGPRKVIAVGTQVLENLDIDVDLLVSDLCPTDRLIQRIGRLHRYELADRPAPVARPVVGIASMRGQESRAPSRLKFPLGVANVHFRAPLETTWTVMSKKDCVRLPEEVPALVHHTYVGVPNTKAREKALRQARLAEHEADVRAVPRSTDGRFRDFTERPGVPQATRKSSGPPEQEDRRASGSRNSRSPGMG